MSDDLVRAGQLAAELADVIYALRLEPDMAFEYVSPAVFDLVGYTPQEHYDDAQLGMRLLDPRDLNVLLESTKAEIGELVTMTVRWIAKDGRVVWTQHRCIKRLRDDGSVVLVGAARDVTEQHDIEERYRLLAENSSDVVTFSTPDGVCTWVSPNVETVLGWAPDTIIGRPVADWVPLEDLPGLRAFQADLARGVPGTLETRVVRGDGESRWMSIRVTPVRDAAGVSIGRVGALRDIQAEHEAREALKASEERYRLLVENSTDVVYLVGPDRLVSWMSANVVSSLGWTADELVGTSMYELIHLDDRGAIDAAREAAYAGRGIDNPAEGCTLRFRRKDGSFVWMSLTTTTVTGPDGAMVAVITGMRNIDALMKQRMVAGSEAARRQAILDSLLDPHVLLRAVRDATGRIVDFVFDDANDAACEYNRTPREELIGARLLDVFPGHAGTGLLAMYAAAVESDKPLVLDDYRYQNEVQGEERYYDIRAVRVGDALSYTWRDVTDRHLAARQLAESEERFRLIATNSTDVIGYSEDGLLRWMSPSLTTALGWEPAEWIGRSFPDFVHPDDLHLFHTEHEQAEAGGSAVVTLRLVDRSGVYHWVEVHSGPYVDESGMTRGVTGSFRVVDREVADRSALVDAEERYRLLSTNASEMIVLSRDYQVVWASPSTLDFVGVTLDQLVGADIRDFSSPENRKADEEAYEAALRGESTVHRLRVVGRDGAEHWVESHMGPYRSHSAQERGVLLSTRLVDDIVAAEQELDRRARFDTLTGLANRKEILQRITSITTSARKPGEHTAVLFCDIDHFKVVNDTYGHAAGDEVLRTLSERISANVRQDDVAARIGGDELLVVLTGIHSLEEAADVAEKIRDAASVSIGLEHGRVTSTLSIGVTLVRPGEDTDALIARADQAMYDAKQGGRNRVVTIA